MFTSPPQHTVQAGSGVLFMAEVTFSARPQNGTCKTIDSFVEQMQNASVMASPAFKLEIRCLSSIDAQGNTLSPRVIDVLPLAVSGPAQADFEAFTSSGDSKRSLTIRLLCIDRTRVLVSQLNPQQCFANQPVKIRYDAVRSPAKVKQVAPSPAPAQVPARRKRGDLTGEYIELSDPTAQPTNPGALLPASVLHVHHVGTQVCG